MNAPEKMPFSKPEAEKSAPSFEDVHSILLESNSITARLLNEGSDLLFLVGVYESEEKATEAEEKLKGLGLSPERNNTYISVNSKFTEKEIDKARDLYNNFE